MPWATIKGNSLITTQFISYCQFISPEKHRGAREAMLTRNKLAPHHKKRRSCFLKICQYHAFLRSQTKAIFMYKQLSLASFATLRAFRQSIKVSPVPVVSAQRNCFSSGKYIFTEYLQSQFRLTCVYITQLPEHSNTD